MASAFSGINVANAAADPQGTLDTFTRAVDAIGSAVGSVSNPEVGAGVSTVLNDITTVRDVLSRLVVNQDLTAAADLAPAAAAAQQSTTALATLCGG